MASIIGDLVYRITGDTKALDNSLNNSQKKLKSFSSSISGLASVIGTVGVGKITKDLVDLASSAEETRNKFVVSFKDVKASAVSTSAELSKAYGTANSTTERLLASSGDLLTGFGFTGDKALELSKKIFTLGNDLASFQNLQGGASDAVFRLNNAVTGETDGLKALGIVVRQDAPEFRKRVQDIQNATGATLQEAKAQAILETAYSQSKNAIGDLQRTKDSYANQTRILNESVIELQESLGQELLPIALDVVQAVKGGVEAFLSLDEGSQIAIAGIAGLTIALPGLITAITALSGALIGPGGVILAVGAVAAAFVAIRAEIKNTKKELAELEEQQTLKTFSESLNAGFDIDLLVRQEKITKQQSDQIKLIQKKNEELKISKKAIEDQIDAGNEFITVQKNGVFETVDLNKALAKTKNELEKNEKQIQKIYEGALKGAKTVNAEEELRIKNIKKFFEELKKAQADSAFELSLNNSDENEIIEAQKELLISYAVEAREKFGETSEVVSELIGQIKGLTAQQEALKNSAEETELFYSKLGETVNSINGLSGFLTGEGSQELKQLVSATSGLASAFADIAKNGDEAKVQASDLVSLFISLGQAIAKVAEQSDKTIIKSLGKILTATTDVKVGLETIFEITFPLVNVINSLNKALDGNKEAWLSLIPLYQIIRPIYNKIKSDNEELVQSIVEANSDLENSISEYVSSLEADLLTTALDIWAEYAKGVIREQSGIQTYLDRQEEIESARAKRKSDQEKAVLKDLLDSNANETEKALAREELEYLNNAESIERINRENASAQKEIDQNLALAKLAIKKAEFESSLSVRLAELRADEASALAGTSDILGPKKRAVAQQSIRDAYANAYAAIGQASSIATSGFDLESSAIQGTLTPEDLEDTSTQVGALVEEAKQPFVITLDGKSIANSISNYFNSNIVGQASVT